MEGYVLAIEGIDGCGKNTQISMLRSYLRDSYLNIKPVMLDAIPSDSLGKYVRELLFTGQVEHYELISLFIAGLYKQNRLAMEYKKNGFVVILNRCILSTYAYNAITDKEEDLIRTLSNKMVLPDNIIKLNITPELAMKRLESRGQLDTTETLSNLTKASERYKYYSSYLSNKEDFVLEVDGSEDITTVHNSIVKMLEDHTDLFTHRY